MWQRASKTYKNFSAKYRAKYNVLIKDSQLVYKKNLKKQQTKLRDLIEQMHYNYNGRNENDERKKFFFRSFVSQEFYVSPMKIQT
jgi:hypothetical protein